jgi:hypothetical protein
VIRPRSTWPEEVGKWIAAERAGHRDLVGPHRFDLVGIDDAHRAIETQRSRYRRIEQADSGRRRLPGTRQLRPSCVRPPRRPPPDSGATC